MEKNPFNELIYQIKEISKSNITENKIFNIGVVISPLPDLIIKTSNVKLDRDNLMIDKLLFEDELNVDDKVVMLREGDIFYIISKVVSI